MKKNIYLAQIIILLSCSYQEKSPVDYLAKTSEMTFNPFIAVLHVPTEDFVNLEDYIVELLENQAKVIVIAKFLSDQKFYRGNLDSLIWSRDNIIIPILDNEDSLSEEPIFTKGITGFYRFTLEDLGTEYDLVTGFPITKLDSRSDPVGHLAIATACSFDKGLCKEILEIPGNYIEIKYFGNIAMYPVISQNQISEDCIVKDKIVVLADLKDSDNLYTPARYVYNDTIDGPDMHRAIILVNAIHTLLNKSSYYANHDRFSGFGD